MELPITLLCSGKLWYVYSICCKCSMNVKQHLSRGDVLTSASCSVHLLKATGLQAEAFVVPLSSSTFTVRVLSASVTGKITWVLKTLEVGGSLEHWGIEIGDALSADESPRSLQLLVLTDSNFLVIFQRWECKIRYFLVDQAEYALVNCAD